MPIGAAGDSNLSPQQPAGVGWLRAALVGYALLTLWMLTYPFELSPAGAPPQSFLGERELHKINTLSNVAVFVPLGVLGAMLGAMRGRSVVRVTCVMTLVVCVMSLNVETVQLRLAERASSLIDLLANTAGGFVGAIVGWAMRGPLCHRWSSAVAWLADRRAARAAVVVWLVIAAARLAPFDLSMETYYLNPHRSHVADLGHPLAHTVAWRSDATHSQLLIAEARVEWVRAVTSAALFALGALVLARAVRESRLRRGERGSPWFIVLVMCALAIVITEAAQLAVRSRIVDTTEPAFGLAGAMLGVIIDAMKGRPRRT